MSTDLADAMAVSLRPVLRAWEAWAADARDSIPRPIDGPRAVADGPSPDRGVATFPDAAAVEAKSGALGDLITRGRAATRQA